MKARNIIPLNTISKYVDRILLIEQDSLATSFNLPLYANGVPTLLFTSQKSKIGNGSANHLTVFGQTVKPLHLTLTPNFTLIAYFFKPYSLLPLFNIAAPELTDKPVDLQLINLRSVKELQEKLLNAPSADEMIALLNNFVISLIEAAQIDCGMIKYATGRIFAAPTKEILVSVQKELRITERTFQRNFESKVGISPNQFRRISQFNSAFYQLLQRRFNKLSDLAYENGYADQSHYIRAFKEFTHITPKEFLSF